MTTLKCKLICHSNGPHLQQIYTGFFMLNQMGLIDLRQDISKLQVLDRSRPPHLRLARAGHVRVLLNEEVRLHYDLHDSYEIDEEFLGQADFYFKRSFLRTHVDQFRDRSAKIRPLGLNYLVYPAALDLFGVKRILGLERGIRRLRGLRSLAVSKQVSFIPTVRDTWCPPDYQAPPKILFMVRAWDPYDNAERLDSKIEQRKAINEVRAACIRALRKEFGDRFVGGFMHTPYAKKSYPDVLVSNPSLTAKQNYMNLLRSFPICVATTGLHGSIGGKFAEYVAYSKAILSERPNYEVPGNLLKDKNYLEFDTPHSCAESATRLFSDRTLREELMANNAIYYRSYVRPDSLVLNSLVEATSSIN